MKTFTKQQLFSILKPLSFLPAILIMCLIFSFSAQTGTESGSLSHDISVKIIKVGNYILDKNMSDAEIETSADQIEFFVRKLAHMTEYCILALSVSLPLYVYGMRGRYLALATALFCIAFAGGDEYHQSFVADRGPSVRDVFIDSIGIFIGTIIVQILSHIIKVYKNGLAN